MIGARNLSALRSTSTLIEYSTKKLQTNTCGNCNLHGKIKHWQLTWFSCDITCARTFDQGHTGQGEVRNSRPYHYHHQRQQTNVFFPQCACWLVGLLVRSGGCGVVERMATVLTLKLLHAPIQRMLNNQHQQQGYAAFPQQSPV